MNLECLGERTVAFAHRDRMADPARGYNALLQHRMRALLAPCLAAGTVIIPTWAPPIRAPHTKSVLIDRERVRPTVEIMAGGDQNVKIDPKSKRQLPASGRLTTPVNAGLSARFRTFSTANRDRPAALAIRSPQWLEVSHEPPCPI
jgi:hypothetical protein